MALVIAMGLLSGYRDEIQAKLVGANADVVVFPLAGSGIEHPEAVEGELRRVPRVRAVSSVIYWQGTAASEAHPDGTNAVVKGVDPEREAIGRARRPAPGSGQGALFSRARGHAGLRHRRRSRRSARGEPKGTTIVLTRARRVRRGDLLALRRRAFRIRRVFRTNFFEYDSEWVFVDREAARDLARFAAPANVVEAKLDSIDRTSEATAAIREALGEGFSA